MRVHLGKAACVRVCLTVCMLCREGWIIFISLLLIRPPHPHPTLPTTTTTLNAPSSPKLFSLPCHSEALFKNTVTLFLLVSSVCVPLTLSSFFTQRHTHPYTLSHMFPLTSFLRQFIWLAEKKTWRKDKSPWNPQNATQKKTEQSAALSPL